MKVNQYSANAQATQTQAKQATKTEGSEKAKNTSNTGRIDEAAGSRTREPAAEISDRAKEMAMAKNAAAAAPDVREARIAELKKRIANNEYNVKPEAIADRLVDEHLKTSGLG